MAGDMIQYNKLQTKSNQQIKFKNELFKIRKDIANGL